MPNRTLFATAFVVLLLGLGAYFYLTHLAEEADHALLSGHHRPTLAAQHHPGGGDRNKRTLAEVVH